jgi:hypothetical protein
MPDPLATLSEIAERSREMAAKCNPSKLPALCQDVATMADVVAEIVRRLEKGMTATEC